MNAQDETPPAGCNDAASHDDKDNGGLILQPSVIEMAFDRSATAVRNAVESAASAFRQIELRPCTSNSEDRLRTAVARTALSIKIYRLETLYDSLSSGISGRLTRETERPSVSDGSSPKRIR